MDESTNEFVGYQSNSRPTVSDSGMSEEQTTPDKTQVMHSSTKSSPLSYSAATSAPKLTWIAQPVVNSGGLGANGRRFEPQIVECANSPCKNGAECKDLISGVYCVCKAGYTGHYCDTNIDDCNPDPCVNGGQCKDSINDFTCDCPPGYKGKTCGIELDECSSNPCLHKGTCLDLLNLYTCQCAAGYTGTNCEIDIDECASNPCYNGATCQQGINLYTCKCVPGFTGYSCQTAIKECISDPCQNGATCHEFINGYNCSCVSGFVGDHCEIDFDECASNPCQNEGLCTDKVNGYSCSCILGFVGVHCERGFGYIVIFIWFIVISGLTVYLYRRTYLIKRQQQEAARKDKVNTSFHLLNHFSESILIECTFYCGEQTAMFVNTLSVYKRLNFSLKLEKNFNARLIGRVSIYMVHIGNCDEINCYNGGKCGISNGNPECTCAAGYSGRHCLVLVLLFGENPQACRLISTASMFEWLRNLLPHHSQGSSTERWSRNTLRVVTAGVFYVLRHCCTYDNKCQQNPCENGGTCYNDGDLYKCIYTPGYEGTRSSEDVDECRSYPCLNGGRCRDESNSFSCECVAGYTGDTCGTEIDECSFDPCQHGGTCYDLIASYKCSCTNRYTGDNCQLKVDLCENNPCLNGATCTDEEDEFSCTCASGYHGYICRQDK
ncbi:hypothetical protein LSH36_2109g00002 [Paralvinella palmiformis]|uniref:EGF-like domain-containing protein n=1 Tax=Paralvinella palmiformis TaxID=53620 RepID=A0AAD9IRG8_9ANNE|nr:hypothetical protein LSH36_2109g00002 [Paralvinella palmiformis]